MLLFPAIDLMSGQVVRLRQGKADQKTVYSDDPAGFARQWEAEGGDWLHLVDLDASFTGEQQNLDAVRAITSAVKIPCELGGGIRTPEAIERALGVDIVRRRLARARRRVLGAQAGRKSQSGARGAGGEKELAAIHEFAPLLYCLGNTEATAAQAD